MCVLRAFEDKLLVSVDSTSCSASDCLEKVC